MDRFCFPVIECNAIVILSACIFGSQVWDVQNVFVPAGRRAWSRLRGDPHCTRELTCRSSPKFSEHLISSLGGELKQKEYMYC